MTPRTLALLSFSLLTAYSHSAFADPPCFGMEDDAKELAKLGTFEGKQVRMMSITCAGMSDHVERDVWILIGDERVDAFDDAESMGNSTYSVSVKERTKTGATYTVSDDYTPYYDYYGPKITHRDTWHFDFATRTHEHVRKVISDPRKTAIAKLERRIRKGDVDGAFTSVDEDFVLWGWELDEGKVMTRLLRSVDYAAKRAHAEDKKRAARMVVRAFESIWTRGFDTAEDGRFSYGTGEGGSESWNVTVTQKSAPAWLYTNLGFYLTEGGEHTKAVQLLTAVVHTFPKHTPAWLNLADAHAALGHDDEALKAYAKYAERRAAAGKKIPSRVSKLLHVTH